MVLATPARNRFTKPAASIWPDIAYRPNALPHGLRDHLRSWSIPVSDSSEPSSFLAFSIVHGGGKRRGVVKLARPSPHSREAGDRPGVSNASREAMR